MKDVILFVPLNKINNHLIYSLCVKYKSDFCIIYIVYIYLNWNEHKSLYISPPFCSKTFLTSTWVTGSLSLLDSHHHHVWESYMFKFMRYTHILPISTTCIYMRSIIRRRNRYWMREINERFTVLFLFFSCRESLPDLYKAYRYENLL